MHSKTNMDTAMASIRVSVVITILAIKLLRSMLSVILLHKDEEVSEHKYKSTRERKIFVRDV